MYVIVRELCHCFHDDRKFLHTRNVLNHIKLWPVNRHVAKEMKEQIVTRAHAVNVGDRRILRARISRDHHVTFLFRLHELLGDVALNNFVSEVPTHRLAAERIDLKALLQLQPAGLESNVHQPRAREVSVSENLIHPIIRRFADTTQAF